jgi:ABC-2 type transport system ATP-binding protein
MLRTTDGVTQVTSQPLEEGLHLYEVRTHQLKDLRETVSQRLAKNGWPIRRLDLKRRSLQDRWNEINSIDPLSLRGAAGDGAARATAVTR